MDAPGGGFVDPPDVESLDILGLVPKQRGVQLHPNVRTEGLNRFELFETLEIGLKEKIQAILCHKD